MGAVARIDEAQEIAAHHVLRLGLHLGQGPRDAARLQRGELQGQLVALGGRMKEPLAPVGGARAALDEVLLDELLQDPVEALLGDPQNVQEFRDGQARVAAHEVQNPVMGPAEAVLVQDPVRIADEVAIGEEEQFDEVIGRGLGEGVLAGGGRLQGPDRVWQRPYPK